LATLEVSQGKRNKIQQNIKKRKHLFGWTGAFCFIFSSFYELKVLLLHFISLT